MAALDAAIPVNERASRPGGKAQKKSGKKLSENRNVWYAYPHEDSDRRGQRPGGRGLSRRAPANLRLRYVFVAAPAGGGGRKMGQGSP